MVVQTNHLSWTPQERDELIDCALRKFMSKRRKLKLDTTSFNMIGVHDRKRTRRQAKLSDSEDESNCDNEQADDEVDETYEDVSGDILETGDFSGSDLSKDDDRQFDVDEAEHILASYENDGQI